VVYYGIAVMLLQTGYKLNQWRLDHFGGVCTISFSRQNKSGAQKSGLTLVELLVGITTIAVLLALLMPSLQKNRELSKRAVCASRQSQLALALMAYINDYDGYIMPYAEVYDKYDISKYWRNPKGQIYPNLTVAEEYWYAMLFVAQKGIASRDVFFCPSIPPSSNSQYHAMTGQNVEERGMGWTYGLRAWAFRDQFGSQWRNERAPKKIAKLPRPSEFYLIADSVCPQGGAADYRGLMKYGQMFYIADFGRAIASATKPGIHLRHLEKAATVFVDGHTGFGDYRYWTELQNPNNWQAQYCMDKPGYFVYAGSMEYRWQRTADGTYRKLFINR
jgi:type II secretory pathway pseudopilin PulG